jgi:Saxitoxin biosynthesis operon protein SxtJ
MAKEKMKGSNPLARWLMSTPEQAKDTGMAMVLISLLLGYWGKFPKFLPVAIALLILTMAWPKAFKPLAVLWFGLSHLLSQVVSRVVLTVVFFLVVTPIGIIRRWTGADTLQLKKWKQGKGSVFVVREGVIQGKDMANPY